MRNTGNTLVDETFMIRISHVIYQFRRYISPYPEYVRYLTCLIRRVSGRFLCNECGVKRIFLCQNLSKKSWTIN